MIFWRKKESQVTADETPPPIVEETPTPAPAPAPESLWSRIKGGLNKSSTKITTGIVKIFTDRKLDDEALEQLEELLITADLGPKVAQELTQALRKEKFGRDITDEEVRAFLAQKISERLAEFARPLKPDTQKHKPFLLMAVGVNGTGKTTTLGKLANQFTQDHKKVMLAAGDTFRAAAVAQLQVWGERANVPVIAKADGADAAGLAYDAICAAEADQIDLLLLDTAGRLHNKADLMAELQKVVRSIKKKLPDAPHLTLLVLDATTGQNALAQAETFKQIVDINGLIITKLDGSAKGGVVLALVEKLRLPIYAIGVGESIEDLLPFDPLSFAQALLDQKA